MNAVIDSVLTILFSVQVILGSTVNFEKNPDPKRTLADLEKRFSRQMETKGLGFSCFVKGGLSRSGDHEIWMHQVYEEHRGTILGNLMTIPEINVYRTPSKGALRDSGSWVPLISTPAGKRLDKVVHFPAELMKRAMREGLGNVEWAPVPEVKEVELDHPDFAEPEEPLEEGTVVVKKKPEVLHDRLRMRLSAKTAVEYFNDVQKSVCLGGLG